MGSLGLVKHPGAVAPLEPSDVSQIKGEGYKALFPQRGRLYTKEIPGRNTGDHRHI